MIKLFLSIVTFLAIALLSSCKKDTNAAESYFIQMKIDGKDFSFSDSLFATKTSSTPELIVHGYSKTQGHLLWSFSGVSTGTYFDSYDPSVKKIYDFTINAIVDYYNNTAVFEQLIRPNPSVSNAISLTITNVSNDYVEGTFNGELGNGSMATATITNGRFKIPFR